MPRDLPRRPPASGFAAIMALAVALSGRALAVETRDPEARAAASPPRGAAPGPEPGCAAAGAQGQIGRRTHKTRDGTVLVFHEADQAWRVDASCLPPQPQQAAPLAIAWSQFGAASTEPLEIAGAKLVLPSAQDRRALGEQQHGDTGAKVWDAAIAFAKLADANPSLATGRRFLEVGAGQGLLSASLARLGAASVVATDLAYCLPALRAVAHAIGGGHGGGSETGATIDAAELDWGNPQEFLFSRPPREHVDAVIAADVVWLLELVDPLVGALEAIARRHPRVDILVAHQTRSQNVEDKFLRAMASRGLLLVGELRGGRRTAAVGQPPAEGRPALRDGGIWVPALRWHEGFWPDDRVKLWQFRLGGDGE